MILWVARKAQAAHFADDMCTMMSVLPKESNMDAGFDVVMTAQSMLRGLTVCRSCCD
nr:hypothetical protein [Psychrobacter immobilis]